MIVLFQIFSWFWQWNNLENWLIFGKVKAYKTGVPILGHPVEILMASHFESSFITRTWLRYVRVFAITNPSVACNVRAPYSWGWNFRQYFFAILYLTHPLTSVQNFTEMVRGNLSVGGVKRKRGSTIERCHVRVSYLLMSLCLVQLSNVDFARNVWRSVSAFHNSTSSTWCL